MTMRCTLAGCFVLALAGAACGSDEPPSGITSLIADKSTLALGESTTITATIAIEGAIASAAMLADGNSIGQFVVDPASPKVYRVTLSWNDIVRPASSSRVGATVTESLEARFVDAAGAVSTKPFSMDLSCGADLGVCREGCEPLADMDDCGRCGNTCGFVTLEADPSTQMSGGINDTRCAGAASALECGEIVYYQNASSSRGPRTCNDVCESQTHNAQAMKCAPVCGTSVGSIEFGNGGMAGEAWYLMQTTDDLVPIADCATAPATTSSGLPLNETRCCCITQ